MITSGFLQFFASFLPLVFLPLDHFLPITRKFLINVIMINSPPLFKIIYLLPTVLRLELKLLSVAYKLFMIGSLPTCHQSAPLPPDSSVSNMYPFLLLLDLHKYSFLCLECYIRTSNIYYPQIVISLIPQS